MFANGRRSISIVLAITMTCGVVRLGVVPMLNAAEEEASDGVFGTPGHLKKLLFDRLQAVRSFAEATNAAYLTDTVTLDIPLLANRELLDAELEMLSALHLPTTPKERLAIYKKMIDNAKQLEDKIKVLHDAGARGGEADKYFHAKAARLRMEIALERELLSTAAEAAEPAKGAR